MPYLNGGRAIQLSRPLQFYTAVSSIVMVIHRFLFPTTSRILYFHLIFNKTKFKTFCHDLYYNIIEHILLKIIKCTFSEPCKQCLTSVPVITNGLPNIGIGIFPRLCSKNGVAKIIRKLIYGFH